MNIIAPITQGYLYSEIYNSVGGEPTRVAGLPISEMDELGPTGGALREKQKDLAIPAGLVVIDHDSQHKLHYKTDHKRHPHDECEVIPDDLFDKLVGMVMVKKSQSRKNYRSGERKTIRGPKK